jgi:hypothetical protein
VNVEEEKIKHRTTIRVAMITAAATIGAAVIGGAVSLINDNDPQTATSTPTTTSPSPPTERRVPFLSTFSDSDSLVDGRMVWPVTDPPRLAGTVKLRGADESNPCGVKILFEAKNSTDQLLEAPKERNCDRSDNWPSFGPVYFDAGAAVMRVDIIVVVNDEPAKRIVCRRLEGCQPM